MDDALHIVCPQCESTNRIPAARLEDMAKCGHCHQPLFDAHVPELTAASFRKHLSRNDIPLLVDFWAPWCAPCQMMAPQYAEAAHALEPKVRVVKVNTDSEPDLATQFGIRSIPTLALFRAGREVARQSGAMHAPEILRWVNSIS